MQDELLSKLEQYQKLCAAAYQLVGAVDGPVEMLDNLNAAASGKFLQHDPYAGLPWTSPIASVLENNTRAFRNKNTGEILYFLIENHKGEDWEDVIIIKDIPDQDLDKILL